MQICTTILDAIGNTPLVRLNRVSEGVEADILAKLENLNPGGSEGPDWRSNAPGRREEGSPEAGGNNHRTYVGKHWDRPCDRGVCKGVQDDLYNARQDERGEEKPPPGIRCKGGRDTDKRTA